jgi:hypothetical protein
MSMSSAATAKAEWMKENLKQGEIYAGLLLGVEGQPDHHLILLPGEAGSVTWEEAKKFAAKAGGGLPTRREQALLFANLQREFKSDWYWSGEQHAALAGYAWVQDFSYGGQLSSSKSARLRARAVRRFAI